MRECQRNVEFDIIKGIGMILMVMGHTYGPESLIWRIVYPFHMPLFFIVSGYFFREKDIFIVIKTSFIRLLEPYIFICIAVTFIRFIQHLINSSIHVFDINSILCGMGPGWFLLSLFWCRILFNCIIKVFPKHFFIISFIVSSAVTHLYPFLSCLTNFSSLLALPQGLSCLIFLAVGYYAKQRDILNVLSSHRYISNILSISFWLISCIFGEVEVSKCIYKLWIIDYLGAIGGSYFCYFIAIFVKRYSTILSSMFSNISKYSIAILSFHTIDYTIFLWHHLDALIYKEHLITIIALGRLLVIYLSIIITSRIPFFYRLFVSKDKKDSICRKKSFLYRLVKDP